MDGLVWGYDSYTKLVMPVTEEDAQGFAKLAPDIIYFFSQLVGPEVKEYPYSDGPYTSLGPECFTKGDVISYKGENYYRACDVLVVERPTGSSHCVKRVGHPSLQHEAFDGTVRYV